MATVTICSRSSVIADSLSAQESAQFNSAIDVQRFFVFGGINNGNESDSESFALAAFMSGTGPSGLQYDPAGQECEWRANCDFQGEPDPRRRAGCHQTGGLGLGWGMKESSPGVIVGTLFLRTHTAVVQIKFDTNTYNIDYSDSVDLKYNAEKQVINRNYNGWIQNLNNSIRAQLLSLS
jgi:hypothetical protein